MISGAEDGPGQIVIMDGVTYVADGEGVLRDAVGNLPPGRPAGPDSMSDPALAVSPYGNPYSGR